MMNSVISVIYFNYDSYLHNLYLGYGVSALKKVSPSVNVYFVSKNNLSEISETLDTRFIVAFLSMDFYSTFKNFCDAIGDRAVIIACHYTPTYLGKELLLDIPSVDYVILGEYDNTLPELLACIMNNGSPLECRGILLRKNGEIVHTGVRPHICNLDNLDFADRDTIPHSTNVFHLFASRGCESSCTFCDRNALYVGHEPKQRFRSIFNVVSEIDHLVSTYNCRFVTFSDATFCSNINTVERLMTLYQQLITKKYWVQFFMNLRVEQINEDVFNCLQQLKHVGLGRVFLGIESFNLDDLKLYNKMSNYESNAKALQLINRYPQVKDDYMLDFEYGFILFNPYTSICELKNNINSLLVNAVPLTPNIISSRLVCDFYQPIARKLDHDGLLTVPISNMTLDQKNSSDLKYRFLDETVGNIYEVLVSCYHILNIKLPGNVCFIRNRYYRFIGPDQRLSNLDNAYMEWKSNMSSFCENLVSTVIEQECQGTCSIDKATRLCKDFKNSFEKTDRKLRMSEMRAFIELQKIGEEVYEN